MLRYTIMLRYVTLRYATLRYKELHMLKELAAQKGLSSLKPTAIISDIILACMVVYVAVHVATHHNCYCTYSTKFSF